MSDQMATIQTASSHRLRAAVAEPDQVISPFQYYTQAGERILCLDQSAQSGSARHYLHLDEQGSILSRLNLGNSSAASDVDWSLIAEESETEPADFAQLMHEMHVSAKAAALYNPEALRSLRELGRGEPILVVGCGRSGTTLLLSMLGAHPQLLALAEETYAFYPFPFRLAGLLDELSHQVEGSWSRWCEKTPKHVRAIPEIVAAFEGHVKIIHLVRDGRNVVTSHHPNAAERYYVSPERWVADVGAGWVNKQHTLLVRYEDLVQQPRQTLDVICEYLNLPFDERLLTFEQHSQVQRNKAWQGGRVSELRNDTLARWQALEHAERVDEFLSYPGAAELMHNLDYQ